VDVISRGKAMTAPDLPQRPAHPPAVTRRSGEFERGASQSHRANVSDHSFAQTYPANLAMNSMASTDSHHTRRPSYDGGRSKEEVCPRTFVVPPCVLTWRCRYSLSTTSRPATTTQTLNGMLSQSPIPTGALFKHMFCSGFDHAEDETKEELVCGSPAHVHLTCQPFAHQQRLVHPVTVTAPSPTVPCLNFSGLNISKSHDSYQRSVLSGSGFQQSAISVQNEEDSGSLSARSNGSASIGKGPCAFSPRG
jgi:hypothetical protein